MATKKRQSKSSTRSRSRAERTARRIGLPTTYAFFASSTGVPSEPSATTPLPGAPAAAHTSPTPTQSATTQSALHSVKAHSAPAHAAAHVPGAPGYTPPIHTPTVEHVGQLVEDRHSPAQLGMWAAACCAIGMIGGLALIGRPLTPKIDVAEVTTTSIAHMNPSSPDYDSVSVGSREHGVTPVVRTETMQTSQLAATSGRSAGTLLQPQRQSDAVQRAVQLRSANASSESTVAPLVTITGCLESNKDGFRLKDTTGTDAPKARSWKSGFLKKGSSSIDVVDARGVGLTGHVGERVAVTGQLDDKDMQAHGIRRVASSCKS